MTNLAYDLSADPSPISSQEVRGQVVEMGHVPRITIHAFCETPEVAGAIEGAAADRRMARAQVTTHQGGVGAACEAFRQARTPNLLVIESTATPEILLRELDALAAFCDASTKVVVIGHVNDVVLYRALMDRGVCDYLVAPINAMGIVGVICRAYREADSEKLGRVCAFIGARGGVGSSTVAHNVASAMARQFGSDVMIADMDIAFGTGGLDFNLDPTRGMAEIVDDTARVDAMLLDRLLTKCENHLSLLAAPAALDRPCDFDEATFDRMIEVAQANVPFIVLDVPHLWSSWAQKTVLAADDVVITATPDLASLRNAKNLCETLTRGRPNDGPPKVILNQVGLPKRPEIKPKDFAEALGQEPIAQIRFDAATFGTAANDGRMIADVSRKCDAAAAFAQIAQAVSGRRQPVERSGAGQLLRKLRIR